MTLLPALWLTLACKHGGDDTGAYTTGNGNYDDDSGGGGGGGDTGPEGPFVPYYLTFQAEFGYDPAEGVVDAIAPPGVQRSAIYLFLGSEDWYADQFSYDSDHYCVMVFPLVNTGTVPRWVADNGLWFGVDYDPSVPPDTTCTGRLQLDPQRFGPDPLSDIAGLQWGVGVGPKIIDTYDSAFDPDFLPYVGGGYLLNEVINTSEGQHLTGYWTYAQELDADHHLLIDGFNEPILVSPEDVPTGPGQIARAWYTITSFYYFY
ncbi:MAG: hypothetical protein R3F59_02920 [Myxococcota bacterium]